VGLHNPEALIYDKMPDLQTQNLRRPLEAKEFHQNIPVFDQSPPYDKSGSKTADSVDKSDTKHEAKCKTGVLARVNETQMPRAIGGIDLAYTVRTRSMLRTIRNVLVRNHLF
jgi:hypothetical protein